MNRGPALPRGLRLLASATLAVLLAGCAAPAPAAPPTSSSPSPTATPSHTATPTPEPRSALFVGDSLTDGFFATTAENGFARLVVAGLPGPTDVVTASRAGADTTTVSSFTDVPAGVDVAVVELGTNDVTRTSVEDFRIAYDGLLGRIRSASPDARLVCLGVWFWRDPGAPFDEAASASCTAAGGTFLPLVDLFEDPALRGPVGLATPYGASDDFHPNDAGHAAIAARVLSVLAP